MRTPPVRAPTKQSESGGSADQQVLSVRDLSVSFGTRHGTVHAVRRVSFDLVAGKTIGLVGESGCGKSTTARAIVGLLPASATVDGLIALGNEDLTTDSVMRRVRGKRIGMIFQDSMTSLNPVLTIGRQITESLESHLALAPRAARERAVELLEAVGVPDPATRLRQYPHQLSGGMRQRVAIAIAIAPGPEVLIADEPTTALDVTIQAQVLDVLRTIQRERQMTLLLISHDLGVMAGIADRIAVMYAGRIVEEGDADEVFANPRHPYTAGLLRSVPRLDGEVTGRLPSIPGDVAPLWSLPPGCPFQPRCPIAMTICENEDPTLEPIASAVTHSAACWAVLASEANRQ